MQKTYLGDGVYAEADDDGLSVTLTTENGIAVTNTIYLEAEVLDALDKFVRAWIYERQRPKEQA
jgi:hypothetical protein